MSLSEEKFSLRLMRVAVFLLIILIPLFGCTPGILYTDITTPYCKDLRGTTLGKLTSRASTKRLSIPVGRVDLTAEWDRRGIAEVAKKGGINTVHGCDSRLVSYVSGIWKQREIIVYGE